MQKRPRISACNRKRPRVLRKSPRIYRPRTLGTYVTYIYVRKCTTCVRMRTCGSRSRCVYLRTCGSRSRCASTYVRMVCAAPDREFVRINGKSCNTFCLHYLTFCLSTQVIKHKTKAIIYFTIVFLYYHERVTKT